MKLSVIIPVYQSAGCIERCVNSVMASVLPEMELILVDDGSTDGSGAICDRLAESYSGIRVVHRHNGGLSAARNTGINAADGDYITFIDSDDEILPATLSDNMDYILRHPETDLLEYPAIVHYASKRQYDLQLQPRTVSGDIIFRDWISHEGYTHCYACNKIFRKELFDGISFPEGETFEDIAICPSIIMRCKCIRYSDKGMYLYYDNPDGISAHYRFKGQEPLFRHNMELLSAIAGKGLQTENMKLWTTCLNLLIDLHRCTDSETDYLDKACVQLESLRPAASCLSSSGISIRSTLKYIATGFFGVKALCSSASKIKPSL